MPGLQEHVFLHEATRTLIVADSVFNLPRPKSLFQRLLLALAGMNRPPGPSRLFRALIKDRRAFSTSLRTILAWNFDRIMVGHGEIVATGGKAALARAFARYLG